MQKLRPPGFRPVFALAAAAGMEGQRAGRRRGRRQAQAGDGVGVKDGQAFERLEIDFGGVQAASVHGPVRSGDEIGAGAEGHIRPENAVRVVEIGDDDIESGEVADEFGGQPAAAGEKAGEVGGFNGLNPVDQAARQGQLGDVGIAEDFQVRGGELPPERGDRRQREHEVADGPAANHQQFALARIHRRKGFGEAARLRRRCGRPSAPGPPRTGRTPAPGCRPPGCAAGLRCPRPGNRAGARAKW